MRIAKGTSPLISVPLAASVAGFLLLFLPGGLWVAGAVLLVVGLPLLAFLLYFFRDPERRIGAGVASPADGIVTEVRQGPPLYVSIFMNVHNVHVNRAPLPGRVVLVEHRPGGYLPAFKKESERNERVVTRLATAHGDLELVQIAGIVARRIVPYVSPGDELAKGERFGMIRLGSRVDLTLRAKTSPRVKAGERVYAGTTTLALIDEEADAAGHPDGGRPRGDGEHPGSVPVAPPGGGHP